MPAFNREAADAKAEKGRPYVAPTVIAEKRGATLGELPDANPEPRPAEPPAEPRVVERIIYQDRPVIQTATGTCRSSRRPIRSGRGDQRSDQGAPEAHSGRVPGALLRQGRTAEAAGAESRRSGSTGYDRAVRAGHRHATVARTGDVAYAVLDRGFNSDDPAAPIFATIVDLDERQQPGPLNGIRLLARSSTRRRRPRSDSPP